MKVSYSAITTNTKYLAFYSKTDTTTDSSVLIVKCDHICDEADISDRGTTIFVMFNYLLPQLKIVFFLLKIEEKEFTKML